MEEFDSVLQSTTTTAVAMAVIFDEKFFCCAFNDQSRTQHTTNTNIYTQIIASGCATEFGGLDVFDLCHDQCRKFIELCRHGNLKKKNTYKHSPDQELTGQGLSNMMPALLWAYPSRRSLPVRRSMSGRMRPHGYRRWCNRALSCAVSCL
mmetsp:Transcript_10982/g.10648  ORF Transcript_10982/g.10648 Transcript_10982/m.10648 type:complete len:150 (+) Transcript_10982:724-1173(+)